VLRKKLVRTAERSVWAYDNAHDVMLKVVRMRVLAAGDLGTKSLVGWSVLGGRDVSDGFIRGGPLPVQSILDVVPPNEHWYLGPRSGRSTAPVAV